MAIAKVIEVIASSTVSIEEAVKGGVAKASETVDGIEGVWIKDVKAEVKNGKITEWRVIMALTFLVR